MKKTAPDKPITQLTAKDIMHGGIIVLHEDMTAQEAAELLTEREISGAPVVDEQEKLVGVVTVTDIARTTFEDADLSADRSNPDYYVRGWEGDIDWSEIQGLHIENPGLLVRDIMTPTVYTVPEDTPVAEIAQLMIGGRIHRLFVTQAQRVVGVVSTLDMLKVLTE